MGNRLFKVWRILEEQELPDGKHRVITKKKFVAEIENPKQVVYVTWCELVEHFGEGYYLVEIPVEIHQRYLVPDKQTIRTPSYFEPSQFVHRIGAHLLYT